MDNNGSNPMKLPFDKISKPIPLLAFLGVFIEGIIGILAFRAHESPFFPILALALLLLPVFFISLIYNLLTKYYYQLYTPSDFTNQDHFLKIFEITRKAIEKEGVTEDINIFKPFKYEHKIKEDKFKSIEKDFEIVESFLRDLDPRTFLSFHSYFNSQNKHEFALLCIDIAISKGLTTSEYFSFRSGSLRKLGRLKEALYSAKIAIELDHTNIDAHYNLCKIYSKLEKPGDADREREIVNKIAIPIYIEKLDNYFNLK